MSIDYDEEYIKEGSRTLLSQDCTAFCLERGFNKSSTSTCADLCVRLYDSLDDRTELSDLVQLLQSELASLQHSLPPRCCTLIADYLSSTLLQHFSLYKYVATENRLVVKKELDKTIEVVENPPSFQSGIPYKVWEYNSKIKNIEQEETVNDSKRAEEVVDLKSKRQTMTNQLRSLLISDDDRITIRERVREMIQTSILTQTELLTKMLEHELSAGQEALSKDVEKVTIPRPVPLGGFPLRVVPSRGAAREVRDMNSNIASRMSISQDTSRKSAGKSRGSKK